MKGKDILAVCEISPQAAVKLINTMSAIITELKEKLAIPRASLTLV